MASSITEGPHLKSRSRKRGAEAKAAAVCALRSGAQSGSTPSSRALRCVGLLASASSTASSCATSVRATAITCGVQLVLISVQETLHLAPQHPHAHAEIHFPISILMRQQHPCYIYHLPCAQRARRYAVSHPCKPYAERHHWGQISIYHSRSGSCGN